MNFNCGFLINMKRRQDRLAKFNDSLLHKLGTHVQIERLEAVDGRNLDYNSELIARINPWNIMNGKPKRYGVIGCCLSHLEAYKKMTNDNDVYIVFEDDVALIDLSEKEIIKKITSIQIPDDWGILYLNNCSSRESKIYTDKLKYVYHYKSPKSFTTEAYLIKGSFAKELYKYNESNLGAIDAHMTQLFEKSKFKQYALDPPIFCQDQSFGTDIQRQDHPPIHIWCPTFVINLKRRPDRLEQFNSRYTKIHSMPIYKKNAVDGQQLKANKTFQMNFSNRPTRLSPGEIGCFISHFEIWFDMVKNGLPFCCVYEDDALFTEGYTDKLSAVLSEVPSDFFITYLGGRFQDNHSTVNGKHISDNIVVFDRMVDPKDQDRTTHAYVISQQCARMFCDELINNPNAFNVPIDHFMIRFLLQNKFHILSAEPLINWSPMRGDSDIAKLRGF